LAPTFLGVFWVAEVAEILFLQDPCDGAAAAAAGHRDIELIYVLVVGVGHFGGSCGGTMEK
jgi:hypothetical protein